MGQFNSRAYPSWPPAPGNAATIVLFTTHDRPAGGAGTLSRPSLPNMDQRRASALELVWLRNDQASAANGIRVYARDDQGVFREVDVKDDNGLPTIGSAAPQAVPVLPAGQERRLLIDVSRYGYGVAVEYTAGATGPTNWNGVITLYCGDEVLVR